MSLSLGEGVSSSFVYKTVIFAAVLMFAFPLMFSLMVPTTEASVSGGLQDDLNDEYEAMTGSQPTSRSVWALTGIYTPYTGGAYGHTPDGWVYGEKKASYSPSQYSASATQSYTVGYWSQYGVYRYQTVGSGLLGIDEATPIMSGNNVITGWDYSNATTYTAVSFDAAYKSDIFFTADGKEVTSDNYYYYEYTGYRYAFQPLSDYTGVNSDGDKVDIVANTTSLSLIWYEYVSYGGIAGQLIITGSDSGLAYITSSQIKAAFNASTRSADFDMVFNGVTMTLTIRMDPYWLARGATIEECYNQGYWSVIVSSLATSTSSIGATDYALNINNIFDTLIDLLTFNLDDYAISDTMAMVASFAIIIPLYAALLAVALNCWPVLAIVALLGTIQSGFLSGIFG